MNEPQHDRVAGDAKTGPCMHATPPAADAPLSERVDAPASAPLPAVGEGLVWRRARRDDLPKLLEFDHVCGALDHPRSVSTLDMLEEDFDSPTFDAETDSAIAFDADGAVAAYGDATVDSQVATIVKVRLDGAVRPDLRGRGIGRALLAWQEARGMQLLASSDERLPGWLNAGVESTATGQRRLLDAAGYTAARWWLTMDRDLAEPIPEIELASPLRITAYDRAFSEGARTVINDAFRDHWGSQPLSADDWQSLERLQAFREDLGAMVLAADDDGSETVVGALASMVNQADWAPNDFSFGYIEVLGVAREWRGRRIAQAMLARALRQMRAEGLERATLDVDSESPTGAVGLYAHLGFREYDRSVTMVKEF